MPIVNVKQVSHVALKTRNVEHQATFYTGMVGLGETFEEVVELMKDLRAVSCDIMTIGQYLQPHARRLPVERYVTPDEFNHWRDIGMDLGFKHVQSSPLTRSSYHAREQANGHSD